jgi:hypothetical protein
MASSPSIYGFPDPAAGTPMGPTGNFGIGMPNLGFDGPINGQTYGFGLPSSMDPHNNIELEGHVTIPASYVCPPLPGLGDLLLAPLIPAFAIKEKLEYEDQNHGLTLVVSLPQVNKLMRDQWNDFVLNSTGTEASNPYYDTRSAKFRVYMREFGESLLNAYGNATTHKDKWLLNKHYGPVLKDFFDMSTEDGFCFLTDYGILQKINFLGIILSTNRADSGYDNETAASSDGFTSLAMAIGKRAECLQLFGPNTQAVKGSTACLGLTRAKCGPEYEDGTFGRFMIVPLASATHDYMPKRCTAYADEAGRMRPGHVWKLGTITEPATREPALAAQELAVGAVQDVSAQRSFDAQGMLPSCYLALGI